MMLTWLQEVDERIGNLRVHDGDLGKVQMSAAADI